MDRDKALLPWSHATLLDHTLARLREVCGEVRILCGPVLRYADRGVPVEIDAVSAGALGGVMTGLLGLGTRPGLFLGVDIPLVPVALLRRLLELAEGHDAVVPLSRRGPEPLCAAYRRPCLEPIRRRIAAGDLKMTSFWPDVSVRLVPESELADFGDPEALFQNLNTPEDYARALDRRS